MPQVPYDQKSLEGIANPPGLLVNEKSTRPDASSIMMATSVMAAQGRLGRGQGDVLSHPRRPKGSKGGGRTKSLMR